MTILAVALLLTSAVADDVASSFNEPGCPALRALYTPDMAKAVGDTRAAFCDGLVRAKGKVLRTEPAGTDGAWQIVTLHAERGRWTMKVDVTPDGRVAGLSVRDFEPTVFTVKKPLVWPIGNGAHGDTYVTHGGATMDVNHHVENVRQRRALDLVVVDAATNKTHTANGAKNTDYLIYGAPIVAAASGTVLVVIDGVPDNEPSRMNRDIVPGNLVVVDHGNGEYAHYAHLIPSSAAVRVGQRVRAGDVLGRVGNSGNSSEPHLHFHVQDAAQIDDGAGIDVVFTNVVVDGGARDRHAPRRGERIRTK